MEAKPLAVDTRTAAQMLSVSPRTIQNYLAAKLLPARKIGRRTVIPVRALEDFLRRDHASPLAAPDALHPILAYLPACTTQQRRDSPVAVAPVLVGKRDDGSGQRILVPPLDRRVALCAAPLIQQPAGMPF